MIVENIVIIKYKNCFYPLFIAKNKNGKQVYYIQKQHGFNGELPGLEIVPADKAQALIDATN